jgi:hypothetical protein
MLSGLFSLQNESTNYESYTELVVLFGLGIYSFQGLYLRTEKHKHKRRQISIPRVGFERTIPVFERTKAV